MSVINKTKMTNYGCITPGSPIDIKPAYSSYPIMIDSEGNLYEMYQDRLPHPLTSESLSTIIRSNLAIHYGKTLDVELMQNITQHIVESIDYVLNKN